MIPTAKLMFYYSCCCLASLFNLVLHVKTCNKIVNCNTIVLLQVYVHARPMEF